MPFNQETQNIIIAAFTSQSGVGRSIPSLPVDFANWLSAYVAANQDSITAEDLQNIFNQLESDPAYENSATKFSLSNEEMSPFVIEPPPAGLEQAFTELKASQLVSDINFPRLPHTQRGAIKLALTTITNAAPLSREVNFNLNEALSNFKPSSKNELTKESVKAFLEILKIEAQYLRLKEVTILEKNKVSSSTWPILLDAPDLTQKIKAQIIEPILAYGERQILRAQLINNTPIANIPQSELDDLDKTLCVVGPLQASGNLPKLDRDLLLSNIPSTIHRGTIISVPYAVQYSCYSFWRIRSERINTGGLFEAKKNQEVIEALRMARGGLESRVTRLDSTITYSALVFSACMTILQYFSQQAEAKSQEDIGLGHALIILPILLGVITGICKQLQGQAKKFLSIVDDSFATLGVEVKNSSIATSAPAITPSGP